MRSVKESDFLWAPSADRASKANITEFMGWLENERSLKFTDYTSLLSWSVTDIEEFWQSIWAFYGVQTSATPHSVLEQRVMPGAKWFPGAKVNYAQEVLASKKPDGEALVYLSEREGLQSISRTELSRQVLSLATELRRLGVKPGDRVVAYLPNVPQAIIALLASASVGAIWASCSPDFGSNGVIDRVAQIKPKVFLYTDGYSYGGKTFNRLDNVKRIVEELDSIEKLIYVPCLSPAETPVPITGSLHWSSLIQLTAAATSDFIFEQVDFDHPLWILFSSGTTGLPKAIMHSHGGIILEMYKSLGLMMDLKEDERIFFYTTTGWMMWNFLVSSLMVDACPVLYDGNPAYPSPDLLWEMAQDTKTSFFGASPTYVDIMDKAGIVPGERYDLSHLKTVMLAGSPVSPECNAWFYDNVKKDIWIASGSGGTDCCTGFVGGVAVLPVYAGEMQAPALGVAACAFNENGKSVIDEVGELVITQPLPSMPVGFWGDTEGKRYHESYFEDFPGFWRHGDLFKINERGGCFVLGRSDSTLNRQGVRIGTAEIYRAVLKLDEIDDVLIVSLDLPNNKFFMPLFVKLADGVELTEKLYQNVRSVLLKEYTPRHVPDKIISVPSIPTTISGKRMEVPVRKILLGYAPDKSFNKSVMADQTAMDFFVDYAEKQQDYVLP